MASVAASTEQHQPMSTTATDNLLNKRYHASTLIIIMSLVTCVLCFIPIYAPYEGSIRAVDDYAYFTGFQHVPIFEQAGISFLFIAVLPGLDILMDFLPSSLFSSMTWYDMKQLKKERSGMTKLEHFLFVIGVICMSSSAWPSVINSNNALNLYLCFQNCCTILTSCSLLSFVLRRSRTWSPIMCLLLSFLICLGPFLSSLSLCFDPTSKLSAQMNLSCNIIICISTGLYLINALWTLYKSFQWEKVVALLSVLIFVYIPTLSNLFITQRTSSQSYLILIPTAISGKTSYNPQKRFQK